MGTPAEKRQVGAETWYFYPRQPYGRVTYVARVGPDGRLAGLEQRLTDANVAKIVPNSDPRPGRARSPRPAVDGGAVRATRPQRLDLVDAPLRRPGLPGELVVQMSPDGVVREVYFLQQGTRQPPQRLAHEPDAFSSPCLPACLCGGGLRYLRLTPGQSTRANVEAAMGAPAERREVAGETWLYYPSQPYGRKVFVARLSGRQAGRRRAAADRGVRRQAGARSEPQRRRTRALRPALRAHELRAHGPRYLDLAHAPLHQPGRRPACAALARRRGARELRHRRGRQGRPDAATDQASLRSSVFSTLP